MVVDLTAINSENSKIPTSPAVKIVFETPIYTYE